MKEGALTQQQWQQQVEVQPFDWRRLARYAFLAALASLVIAFTSLFNDSDLLAWLSGLFRFDVLARMVIASVLAALAYAWALRRRRFHPEKRRYLSPCCSPPAPCGKWACGWTTEVVGFPCY